MPSFDPFGSRRSGPFRVLFVCTGNICRSPQAVALVRPRLERIANGLHSLDPALAIQLRTEVLLGSAGTHATQGAQPPEPMTRLTAEFGGDMHLHRATSVTPILLDGADLVLTMEREQRARVAHEAPSVSRHVFTLIEFTRLLGDLAESGAVELPEWPPRSLAEYLRDVTMQVAARRGLTRAADEDVVDPYGRDESVYRRSTEQVAAAVGSIFDSVRRLAVGAR